MKHLNKNKLVDRLNKLALDFAKLALFFVIAFLVELAVEKFLVGFDSAILEFALNELGNAVVVKFLVRLLLVANALRGNRLNHKK